MTDYTPTTTDIETAWMAEVANEPSDAGYGKVLHRERQQAFDRWLAERDASILLKAVRNAKLAQVQRYGIVLPDADALLDDMLEAEGVEV